MSTFLFDILPLEIGEIIFSLINFFAIPFVPEFDKFFEIIIKRYYTSFDKIDVESCRHAIFRIEKEIGKNDIFGSDCKDIWFFISKHRLDKYLVFIIHRKNVYLEKMIPWIVEERNEFFMDMFLKNNKNEFWQDGVKKMKNNERSVYYDEKWIKHIWNFGHFDLIKKYKFSKEVVSYILNDYMFCGSKYENEKMQWIENNSEMVNWKRVPMFSTKLLSLDNNIDFAHRLLKKGLIYKPHILYKQIILQCAYKNQWKMVIYIIYNSWELVEKYEEKKIFIEAAISKRVDVLQALIDANRIARDTMMQYLIENNNIKLLQEIVEFL